MHRHCFGLDDFFTPHISGIGWKTWLPAIHVRQLIATGWSPENSPFYKAEFLGHDTLSLQQSAKIDDVTSDINRKTYQSVKEILSPGSRQWIVFPELYRDYVEPESITFEKTEGQPIGGFFVG